MRSNMFDTLGSDYRMLPEFVSSPGSRNFTVYRKTCSFHANMQIDQMKSNNSQLSLWSILIERQLNAFPDICVKCIKCYGYFTQWLIPHTSCSISSGWKLRFSSHTVPNATYFSAFFSYGYQYDAIYGFLLIRFPMRPILRLSSYTVPDAAIIAALISFASECDLKCGSLPIRLTMRLNMRLSSHGVPNATYCSAFFSCGSRCDENCDPLLMRLPMRRNIRLSSHTVPNATKNATFFSRGSQCDRFCGFLIIRFQMRRHNVAFF